MSPAIVAAEVADAMIERVAPDARIHAKRLFAGTPVGRVASRAAVAPRTLRKHMNRAHCPPLRELRMTWRLLTAVALLAAGTESGEAAYVAGFASEYHLSNALRRLFGIRLRAARAVDWRELHRAWWEARA